MASLATSHNFTSDLRRIIQKQPLCFPAKGVYSNGDATESHGFNLRDEILALVALDQGIVQNSDSDLNVALNNYFKTCQKLPFYEEKITPITYFGGLGTDIFRSMEKQTSVRAFRNLPEVKQRLSEIEKITGAEIESADLLGNLLHDLRQVIFLLALNPSVDKDSLLALIRTAWINSGGKETEEFNYQFNNSQEFDFAQTEAASLINFFSLDFIPFPPMDAQPHTNAFE
nr:hypothetical protein HmN_000639800 [Hymenolepis microstoma]